MSTLKTYFLAIGVAVTIAVVALAIIGLPKPSVEAETDRLPDDFCDLWFSGGAEVPDFAEQCETSIEPSHAAAAAAAVRRFKTINGQSFLASIPKGWADRPHRQALVLLHGSAGHPGRVMCELERMRPMHNLALVAIPNVELSEANPASDTDIEQVDEAISDVLGTLKPACPGGTEYFLYGVSRGARQALSLAAIDLARPAGPQFAAYLLDTAPWFDTGFSMPKSLKQSLAERDKKTFADGRFWLYCGNRYEPMCPRVEETAAQVKLYGGQVDALVRDPNGVHGLFHNHTPLKPGVAAEALFAYVASFVPTTLPPAPPARK